MTAPATTSTDQPKQAITLSRDPGHRSITLRFQEGLYGSIMEAAKAEGRSFNSLVNLIMERHLADHVVRIMREDDAA